MRVLLVDDDIIIRHFFIRSLRRHVEVEVATGLREALAKLERDAFDVIIADEHLPDGRGRALLSRARTLQAQCRRVLISAAELELEDGGDYERFFPKVGGLPLLVGWVKTVAAAPPRT